MADDPYMNALNSVAPQGDNPYMKALDSAAPGTPPENPYMKALDAAPTGGEMTNLPTGFKVPGEDCSLFTQRSMKANGVDVPRTAIQQYRSTPMVLNQGQLDQQKLQPGDLLFWDNGKRTPFNTEGKAVMGESGPSGFVNHVGIYIGNGKMAEDNGSGTRKTVSVSDYPYTFMGATRPLHNSPGGFSGAKASASGSSSSGSTVADQMHDFNAMLGPTPDTPQFGIAGSPTVQGAPVLTQGDHGGYAVNGLGVYDSTGKLIGSLDRSGRPYKGNEAQLAAQIAAAQKAHTMAVNEDNARLAAMSPQDREWEMYQRDRTSGNTFKQVMAKTAKDLADMGGVQPLPRAIAGFVGGAFMPQNIAAMALQHPADLIAQPVSTLLNKDASQEDKIQAGIGLGLLPLSLLLHHIGGTGVAGEALTALEKAEQTPDVLKARDVLQQVADRTPIQTEPPVDLKVGKATLRVRPKTELEGGTPEPSVDTANLDTTGSVSKQAGFARVPGMTRIQSIPFLGARVQAGLDAANNYLGGALSTTTRLFPQVAQAFREFADSHAQGYTIWNGAKNLIDSAVGEKGYFDKTFYPTLAHNNLLNTRTNLQGLIGEVGAMTDFETQYPGSAVKGLVDQAGGGHTVDSLLQSGHIADARQAALDTIQGALDSNNDILTQGEYDINRNSPNYQTALQLYKSRVEPELASNHQRWGGVPVANAGGLDAYAPLVREGDAMSMQQGAAFKPPKNVGNTMRTGTGTYTTDPGQVLSTIMGRTRGSAKDALITSLNENGLIRAATPADYGTLADPNNKPGMNIGGVDYNTVTMPNGQSVPLMIKDPVTGKMIYKPGVATTMPDWVHAEMGQFLQPRPRTYGGFNGAYNVFNTFAVAGITEPLAHEMNVIGGAAAYQPWVGHGPLSIFANIPGVKAIASLVERSNVDFKDPQTYTDMVELSRHGLMPTRLAKTIGGKDIANPVKRWVFGEQGQDMRNRIVALRMAKTYTADPQAIYDYVAQAGTYTRGLDSGIERALKGSGVSPFATAAKTKLLVGTKSFFGLSKLPGQTGAAAIIPRMQQMATGGAAAYVASWWFGNKALGNDPSKIPLGDIPLPKSWPGVGGMTYRMGYTMPYAAAGATDSGARAVTDTLRAGGTPRQAYEAWQSAMLNTAMKPIATSPTANFVANLTGHSIYAKSLLDPEAKSDFGSLLQTGPEVGLTGRNLLYALSGATPARGFLRDMGIVKQSDWVDKRQADQTLIGRLGHSLMDTLMPGAVTESNADLSRRTMMLKKQAIYQANPTIPPKIIDNLIRARRPK